MVVVLLAPVAGWLVSAAQTLLAGVAAVVWRMACEAVVVLQPDEKSR